MRTPFRQCRIAPFARRSRGRSGRQRGRPSGAAEGVQRLSEANELEADWESVSRADNAMLVNALSMMAPYGPAEKQALLEAADLKTRAETLIAITEMTLAQDRDDFVSSLQ